MKLHLNITENDLKLLKEYKERHKVNIKLFDSNKLIVLFNKLPKTGKLAVHQMHLEEIITLCIYYMLNLISLKDAKDALIRYVDVIPKYEDNILKTIKITKKQSDKKQLTTYTLNITY